MLFAFCVGFCTMFVLAVDEINDFKDVHYQHTFKKRLNEEDEEFYKGLRERIKQLEWNICLRNHVHFMKRMRRMNPLVLIACLSPIVIIWIVMKLSLLLFSANDERRYVKAESKNHTDHMWQMHMQTLTRRKRVW